MIDWQSPCEYFKFFELQAPINGCVFSIGFFEESGCILNSCPFVDECSFSVDLFDLLWLEIISGLEFCNLSQFFVDVANPLLECLEERFVLLFYNLYFIFRIVLNLWLRFFWHYLNIKLIASTVNFNRATLKLYELEMQIIIMLYLTKFTSITRGKVKNSIGIIR